MTSKGPFETGQEARAAAHEIIPPGQGHALSAAQCRQLIAQTCAEHGVVLGSYDHQVLVEWMSQWGTAVCEIVADAVIRAHEAGQRSTRQEDESSD
jgi:hypothetical protein